jgi:hypothetical protein
MQAVSQKHTEQLAQASQAFQEKMKAATTNEERRAFQLEFQQKQRSIQEELQREMEALKAR